MFDLNTSILDSYGEELDGERLEEYINELMAEFEESPEAEAFMMEFDAPLGWPATYMHYAANYFCATPATITPGETGEILFEIFPRKVSAEAEAAGEIIAEMRAFWQFLKRTRSLENADDILGMLTDEDADDLEARLADPNNFGMAKSFVTMGTDAGFDMTNQEDMNRFMLAYNASLLGEPTGNTKSTAPTKRAAPMQPPTPIQKDPQHVGRNEPCPCGSGRKYKKCCA